MMSHMLAQNGDLRVMSTMKGWGELFPKPDPEDVTRYYGVDDAEYHTPDGMAWLMKERREHEAGLWKPFYDFQRKLLPNPYGAKFPTAVWNLADVGAGAGWFVHYWNNTPGDEYNEHGGNAWGIEPSKTARQSGPCEWLLYESLKEWNTGRDSLDWPREQLPKLVVRFSLVLEHVPDPVGFLRQHLDWPGLDVKKVLVIVPNEFNPLQKAMLRRNEKDHIGAWFVDRRHLNYFDPSGLRVLFQEAGLKVVFESSTFPMELALLAGMDYCKDEALGLGVHLFRLKFEKALGRLAFRVYKILYDRWGIGRELVFVGEPAKEKGERNEST